LIYFLHSDKFIKIGFSRNGFRSETTFNPYEITLLGWIEGDREKELELHHQFDHLRVKRRRGRRPEWFHCDYNHRRIFPTSFSLTSRRSDGSISPSTAITSGPPSRSETPSGPYEIPAPSSSTPLSVLFREDSAMTPIEPCDSPLHPACCVPVTGRWCGLSMRTRSATTSQKGGPLTSRTSGRGRRRFLTPSTAS
jgi:hypothetical protein